MTLLDKMFSIEEWEANRATVRLHADHPIYKAHFPGNPVTPGVCLIQIVGELTAKRFATPLQLLKVVNLKFAAPVSPVATPVLDIMFTSCIDDGQEIKTKGTILHGEQVMTKFSLQFQKKTNIEYAYGKN